MENTLLVLLLFAPLLGGFFNFYSKSDKGSFATIGAFIPFLIGVYLLISDTAIALDYEWLPGYELNILIDKVSALLISLVSLISGLVHLFSIEYMREDDGKSRYFFKLGFFTFSMIGLLLADHLLLLFVFWELVGLASYLLIGFWYRKDGVPASARLAFMINRVADVALLAGLLILNDSGSLKVSELEGTWLFLPSLLVAIGAFGKSAQLPFSGWLTKAMVGPTPVSALIHAATMVAAGVYLLFRTADFLHPQVLMIIALTGTFTALYGGVCALIQHDIKKVLAYSTISQLGYMVLGIGVGAHSASMFHLFTHAFFKAGLFLGAGAIIHYLHQVTNKNVQDMRNMGGLKSQMPWTYRAFLVCGLALAGVPLFSGFMSKEGIIIAGWAWAAEVGTWAYLVPDLALITAFLTSLYVGRMILLVFWGENRLEGFSRFIEPLQVKLPLIVLALGSFWFFYSVNPIAHTSWLSVFWGAGLENGSQMTDIIVTFLSILLAGAGLVLAYAFFKPGTAYYQSYGQMTKSRFPLLLNGLYLVQLYQSVGRGIFLLSKTSFWIDRKFFDGFVHFIGVGGVVVSKVIALVDRFIVDGPVNLLAYVSAGFGKLLAAFSSRDLQTQMAWLLLGLILILSWILLI